LFTGQQLVSRLLRKSDRGKKAQKVFSLKYESNINSRSKLTNGQFLNNK